MQERAIQAVSQTFDLNRWIDGKNIIDPEISMRQRSEPQGEEGNWKPSIDGLIKTDERWADGWITGVQPHPRRGTKSDRHFQSFSEPSHKRSNTSAWDLLTIPSIPEVIASNLYKEEQNGKLDPDLTGIGPR